MMLHSRLTRQQKSAEWRPQGSTMKQSRATHLLHASWHSTVHAAFLLLLTHLECLCKENSPNKTNSVVWNGCLIVTLRQKRSVALFRLKLRQTWLLCLRVCVCGCVYSASLLFDEHLPHILFIFFFWLFNFLLSNACYFFNTIDSPTLLSQPSEYLEWKFLSGSRIILHQFHQHSNWM